MRKITAWRVLCSLLGSLLFLAGCSEQLPGIDEALSKTIVLRFGHDSAVTSPQHIAAERFAQIVAQKSNGRIRVDVYPDQSLGSDRQMIDMAQKGELDIILPPTAKLSHLIPKLQLFDLPFLFPTLQTAHLALDGKAGNTLLSEFSSHNLIGVTLWESGFKQLTSNHPLNTPEDFNSLKFRIMESPLLRDQFAHWGAQSLAIDFGKTYDVLKDNIVDGQENPLTSIVGMKFYEVQKYLYLSNHGYLAQAFVLSKPAFERLSEQDQKLITQSALETTTYQRQQAALKNQQWLNFLAQQQIVISPLPPAVLSYMQQRARVLLEKCRLRFGTELIEDILEVVDEQKDYGEDELVIALDADMRGISALSGLSIRRGIELAIDEINQNGGVFGKRLVLSVRDNSMMPARGLANIKHFAQHPNLVAFFSGISSPTLLAQLEFIHQNKILTLDPWAAATSIIDNGYTPNYVYRVSVRDDDAAGFLLQHALEVSNKVALVLVNNSWGRSNHLALSETLEQMRLEPTTTQWFEWGKKDFAETVEALYQSDSEVLVFVGNPVEAGYFFSQLANHPKPIPAVSHWGITGGYFASQNADALAKLDLRILQTFSFIGKHNAKIDAFVEKYKAKYATGREQIVAPAGTAHAYDLTHMLYRAMLKAGSTQMSKVRDALETLDEYQGLVKQYKPPFTPTDHDALGKEDFILTRYKNGYLVPLHPGTTTSP